METIEYRKRIEYRPSLKVVRTHDLQPVTSVKEVPDLKTVREVPEIRSVKKESEDLRKAAVPVDHRGYIKCKTHDFF